MAIPCQVVSLHYTSSYWQNMQAALAALAMPGQDSAHALGGRRALRGTLFDGAVEALSNQLPVEAQAAASEAGRAAGREVNHFLANLASPMATTSAPQAEPAPVAVPMPAVADSEKVRRTSFYTCMLHGLAGCA